MCRKGYFLFLKKRIWASKFFYRTSNLLFHLSCGQVEYFLICQPLLMFRENFGDYHIRHFYKEIQFLWLTVCFSWRVSPCKMGSTIRKEFAPNLPLTLYSPTPGIIKFNTQHNMATGIGRAGTTYLSSFSSSSVDIVPEIDFFLIDRWLAVLLPFW